MLLSSTTPSALLAGLPAGFLTSEMHVIAPQTIQGESSSIQGQLSKVYWKGQIENIKTEFDEVKGLGLAAAEEWLKGLEARGKQVRADASRWEKWDISGGVRQMRLTDTQAQAGSAPSPPNWRGQGQRTTQTEMEAERKPLSEATSEPDKPTPETKYVPVRSQARLQGNKKRTKEEVVELKRERKAEIERRAGLLDPPLTPAVLAHIPTFQAALQLIAPLDEDAWEILRPRLLAQRAKAEKRERESLVSAMGPKGTSGQGESATSRRDPRQVPDAEWDEIQGPVRARISSYADEIITDGWNGGDKVGKKNCPQFAAEVLVYVRKRFYAEVAKDTAAAAAAGKELVVDPAEGPWTQKLTVENMKWVFDVKIKPHTDKHRKELFQCNGCQGNSKYYGLEGVIQHYAAKHTDALSLGNVVVYWRAEWPATPPFNPDPNSKHATQQQPADRRAQPAPPSTTQPPFSATSSGNDPSPATHQAAQFAGNAPYGHAAPAPHPPPAIYGPGTAPPAPYSLSYTQQPYSPQALYPPYTTGSTYSSSHPPPAPTPGAFSSHRPSSSHSPYPDAGGSMVPMAAFDNEYKTRLDFMARVARQTWNRISHVDGLPGAVRLCVTIHHIAKGFEMHFSDSAPLEMFMYGLSNHKEMRPIRSINGLKCKPCVEGMAAQDKSLSVPQLVKHFHKTHVEVEARPLDWRIQMILLPELHVLEGLPTVLAYNRAAYDTVADALPWAFRENREIAQPHPGNRPYDRFPIPNAPSYQLQGSYNPSYVAVQRHGGRGYAAHQPAAASLPEQPPERLPYYAGNPDSGRPNLRPAHQVYGRAEPPRVPVKREFNDSERHTGSESGRPDKAPRVVLEERSRDVPGLPATKPLPSMDDMRGQRDYPLSSYAYNGHLENRDPTTERWEGNRHNMDPRASATSAAENGFKLLDALESHLDGSQARPGQVPASRPAEYHPADPARYATAPEWSRPRRPSPPPYAPQQNDYYQDRRPTERHYPPSQTAPEYRYRDDPPPRPAEEYELLEVRDPQHGTYYIRRPSRREFYAYHVRDEDRTHEYPQFNGGGRSGTVAPASTADLEEYDPRFPAGDMPPQPSRYP